MSYTKEGQAAGPPGGLSQGSCSRTDILKSSWESLPLSENLSEAFWTYQVLKVQLSYCSLSKSRHSQM